MAIKTSVVVPIYNGEADIPGLVECLRAQTYPADRVEYLLVDNNSQDRTACLLEEAQQQAGDRGLNLRHLSEPIQSSYAARNRGIRAASGDIIAFTDADCRPHSDWLEKLIHPFTDSAIAIVVGEVVALPGQTLLEKYACRYHLMSQKFLIEHPFCAYGQTANLAIRRQAFEQIGLFRPQLSTGGDADICWRILRETAWKLKFAPEAIIRHRHRSTLRSFRSQWQRYGRSNQYLHQLHGVELMRELTFKESIYRLSRWLLKEIPRDSIRIVTGKAEAIDLIKTPIDLIGFQARTAGQKEAQLPETAKEIERLSD